MSKHTHMQTYATVRQAIDAAAEAQESATVELSDGVSMEADTDEQVQAIADASMHTLAEVRQAIDDARPTVESQR